MSHPTRRALHRAYIRKCLDNFAAKPAESNVIHLTSAEFTGPLHFVQFWLDTVAEWAEPNRKGVICYVEDGKPRGFLLWDVWGKVDAAREMIRAGTGVDSAQLAALLD